MIFRKLRYLPGFVASIVLFGILHPVAAQVPTGTGPLFRGVVMDAESGIPLATGFVSLLDSEGTELFSVLTDEAGRYLLQAPSQGTFRLRAGRVGYHLQEKGPFFFQASDTVTVDFRLSPSPLLLDSILVSVRRRARPLRTGEQLVYGRLLDDETGDPIPQGLVRLLGESEAATTTLSDNEGLFWLVSPQAGSYRLQAERIGYKASTGPELLLMPGDSIGVDFYLSVEAVLLNPIVVRATARRLENRYDVSDMEAFYRRYAQYATARVGDFLTRDSLAAYEDQGVDTNVLMVMKMARVSQFNVMSGGVQVGSTCSPDYYLNGDLWPLGMPIWAFAPNNLEAVEVYERPEIPPELNRSSRGGRLPCGVVAYWTRRAPDPEAERTWWRSWVVGFGLLALGVFFTTF